MMGARYHGKHQKTTYDNQQDPNTSNTARNELGNGLLAPNTLSYGTRG